MQVNIVITRDGGILVLTPQGTFTEGKEKIEQLIRDLQASGIEFESVGQVETHRHDQGEEHVHDHVTH